LYFPFVLTIGNVKARHQLISFSGNIVYCRVPSEVDNAANNILGKIESTKVPDPVSLGFDPEWGALSKKRFDVLSILILSRISFSQCCTLDFGYLYQMDSFFKKIN
jgi:hypothetical protein